MVELKELCCLQLGVAYISQSQDLLDGRHFSSSHQRQRSHPVRLQDTKTPPTRLVCYLRHYPSIKAVIIDRAVPQLVRCCSIVWASPDGSRLFTVATGLQFISPTNIRNGFLTLVDRYLTSPHSEGAGGSSTAQNPRQTSHRQGGHCYTPVFITRRCLFIRASRAGYYGIVVATS
ncbi:hypothetical protein BDW62DRAFT_157029 [Aspergillus aurantiobrunneus]